jgi:glutaminyl-tRNA synthetase
VRLRNAYFIRCDEVVKDAGGTVVELRCSYDPDSLGKTQGAERKKSTAIQWVSAQHAVTAEVRLYDRLLTVPDPEAHEEGKSFKDYLNPRSVEVIADALVEPSLAQTPAGERFQFVRHGYFVADSVDSRPGALVFNRIVELPDAFNKALDKQANGAGSEAAKPSKGKGEPKGEPAAGAAAAGATAVAAPATGSFSDERARARSASSLLAQRYDYYIDVLGLTPEQADVLTGDETVVHFFDAAVAVYNNPRASANAVANDVLRELKGRSPEQLPFSAVQLAELVKLQDQQAITSAGAKSVFATMLAEGGSPGEIVRRLGLDQVLSAEELAQVVDQVLEGLPAKVAEYRAGKTSLLGMFTGQVIKATGGKASPQAVQEILKDRLA